ncbi:hypothetical protein [Natrinema halophilum]|uniref:Uncharacterized protein n=1 Tax=Natrinema halophilum TaxID=1699371 RepID=A0A7D5H5N0_9EURY|nr:hypothetical protein [Natrinema halophilum]QLG48115.1 hypothetical protein HYG82_04260 [Natrinema halophilum]
MQQKGATFASQPVLGRAFGRVLASREETATDEDSQSRIQPGAIDHGIGPLEGVCDSTLVAPSAVALATGDGLEAIALEGGEGGPDDFAVGSGSVTGWYVCSSGAFKAPRTSSIMASRVDLGAICGLGVSSTGPFSTLL